ncbi:MULTISPECIES: hypothetical protein [unclassified Actinotalea]|uniref:hypothetical protein n=1 Tax=unclassified Actinotalea TaxID=2638618 RepID=UPI0015F5C2C6|nr:MULTISPECIES: hypothetical protein [unclassified Actinotalea]
MTVTPLERQRRVRRRWLVWATLPLWLGAFVFGTHLAVMNIVAATARGQYHDGSIGGAAVGWTFLKSTDPVEKWKAPFGLGTTLTKGEDGILGQFYLVDALEVAPDDPTTQCLILINYAIALEMTGDEALASAKELAAWADEAQSYVDAGQEYPPGVPWSDATPEELRADAAEEAEWAERDYAEAVQAREECEPEGQSSEQQQQNEESSERLEEKQEEAQGEQEQQEQEQEQDQSEEERRQEELEQRNREAQQQAERERQEQEGEGGAGTKNW